MTPTPSIDELAKAAVEAHDAIYANPKVVWMPPGEAIRETVSMLPSLEAKFRECQQRPESDHLYAIISAIRALVSLSSRVEKAEAALEQIALLDEADGHLLTVSHAFEAIAIATKTLGKHPSEIYADRLKEPTSFQETSHETQKSPQPFLTEGS